MLGLLGVGPLNSYHANTNYFRAQAVYVLRKHPPAYVMDLRPCVFLYAKRNVTDFTYRSKINPLLSERSLLDE